ncbi:unnamed protein product [Larinioides sclopetarius]|uniref:GH18 domain-containing protein n=1 Tax=Larinioides sclopetarius TaxID=280406 RepID=A0AAV1ZYW1_9ARAC
MLPFIPHPLQTNTTRCSQCSFPRQYKVSLTILPILLGLCYSILDKERSTQEKKLSWECPLMEDSSLLPTPPNKDWGKKRESVAGPFTKLTGMLVYDEVDYLIRQGLGGGMIWALETDDFTGKCGGGKYSLLSTIYKNLNG